MSGSLGSIINNAASGLGAAKAGIAVISNNVANAGVATYTTETQDVSTFEVDGQSYGVQTGTVSTSINAALLTSFFSLAGSVGAATVQSQVLTAINETQGTPGGGTSLADAVSALQTSFTTLQGDPSSQAQQTAVVAAANTLAGTINTTATAITAQENSVQSQIVSSVDTLNTALATVQSTTQQIMAATASGGSTASLEDQRDAALQTLSSTVGVQYSEQSNGDISLSTQGGLSIPLDSTFSTQSAVLSPASTAPGSSTAPAIMLQTGNPDTPPVNVTSQLTGGSLGALVQLRDTTLPGYTASLDQFSANLANQFSAAGLNLFTDGSGSTIPATGYAVGLSSGIEVNPTVTATPSLVVNGTTGTANPSGVADFTGVIDAVLNTTFASNGTTPSLETQAGNFISQQSSDTAQAGANLTNATAYQTTVGSALSGQSGVDVDQQMGLMIQLQNTYQANAQVITTASQMFTALTEIFVQAAA
jgi:flagellar hook-associated protein 1 FlgK